MGWAEQRSSDGKWRARWRDRYNRKDGTDFKYPTEAKAKRYADKIEKTEKEERRKLREEAKQLPPGADPNQTFAAYADAWYEALDVDPASKRRYQSTLENHLLPRWKDYTLAQLSVSDLAIRTWSQSLAKHYAESTIRSILSLLGTILGDAQEAGHINRNPARQRRGRGRVADKRMARRRAQEKTPLQPLEVFQHAERIAILTGRDEDFIATLTLAYTGMRWSELVGMQPPKGSVIKLRRQLYGDGSHWWNKPPKDGSARDIDLFPGLAQLLDTIPRQKRTGRLCPCGEGLPDEYRHEEGDTLFTGKTRQHWSHQQWMEYWHSGLRGRRPNRSGTELPVYVLETGKARVGKTQFGVYDPSKGGLYGQVSRWSSRKVVACWVSLSADVEGPHLLRHTHKSELAELRLSEVVRDYRLGHSPPGVAKRYEHLISRSRRQLVDGLQGVWDLMLDERLALGAASPVPVAAALLEERAKATGRDLAPKLPHSGVAYDRWPSINWPLPGFC